MDCNLKPNFCVLVYIPNIIGYIRLALLVFAFYFLNESFVAFLVWYCISVILDGIDGYFARRMQQVSKFGAWFDILIDNISRSLVWSNVHPMLILISCIEWTVFVCNHSLGSEWKSNLLMAASSDQQPRIIAKILDNNFRNGFGAIAIAGLHVLPLWCLAFKFEFFHSYFKSLPTLPWIGLIILSFGRLICLIAEIWSIWRHISFVLLMPSVTNSNIIPGHKEN